MEKHWSIDMLIKSVETFVNRDMHSRNIYWHGELDHLCSLRDQSDYNIRCFIYYEVSGRV